MPPDVTMAMKERELLNGIERYTKLLPRNKASMALVDGKVVITKQMWDEESDSFIPTIIMSMTVADMVLVRKFTKDNLRDIDDFLVLANALT
jgi:hypothetical protein